MRSVFLRRTASQTAETQKGKKIKAKNPCGSFALYRATFTLHLKRLWMDFYLVDIKYTKYTKKSRSKFRSFVNFDNLCNLRQVVLAILPVKVTFCHVSVAELWFLGFLTQEKSRSPAKIVGKVTFVFSENMYNGSVLYFHV